MSDQYYEDLATRLTDEKTPLTSAGAVKTGEAAAADGRAFLLGEYGSEEAIQEAMRTGRPRVGSEKGAKSPVVRGSITPEDHEALKALMKRTGRSEAALVREAVHHLIHQKAAS